MKITSDPAHHLFSGGTIFAQALKGAHAQIIANPFAETGMKCAQLRSMSVLPSRNKFRCA